MANRYDDIPNQQELANKQIKCVESAIEQAALQNDDKACIDIIIFNPNQKRKLEHFLKSKGYNFVEKSQSILVNL